MQFTYYGGNVLRDVLRNPPIRRTFEQMKID
jgi:hypothetical protein